MMNNGICKPRAERSALYHSRGLVSSALVNFNGDQRWHFCHTEYDTYSVHFELVSLYLDRDVFEQNFEIIKEE